MNVSYDQFSTAGFRIGHTMVTKTVQFLDNNAVPVREVRVTCLGSMRLALVGCGHVFEACACTVGFCFHWLCSAMRGCFGTCCVPCADLWVCLCVCWRAQPLSLRDAFFSTGLLQTLGIDPVLKYLASDRAAETDAVVVDDLRNFLFGAPGQGGLDLAALNIQRGRDHGLPDLNSVRVAYGLPPHASFASITTNSSLAAALSAVYGGDVGNVDLWLGGICEDHVPGGSVGGTFAAIIVDQFTRVRDGDRFWYQNVQQAHVELARQLGSVKLADVIKRNTGLTNVQVRGLACCACRLQG